MQSKRQAQVSRMIQKELADIFLYKGKQIVQGGNFITISKVNVSPDFSYAKVYMTFMNRDNPERSLELVEMHKNEIRGELGNKIRNKIRKIPELQFFYDDSLDYIEHLDDLFDTIKKQDEALRNDATGHKPSE